MGRGWWFGSATHCAESEAHSQSRLVVVFLFAAVIATIATVYSNRCSIESTKLTVAEMIQTARKGANELRELVPKKYLLRFKRKFTKVDRVEWLEDEPPSTRAMGSKTSPVPSRKFELDD